MRESLKYTGDLTLTLRGPDGDVKDSRFMHNTLLSAGLDYLIKTTMDSSLTAMTCFYIGETASGAAVTQTEGTGETVEVDRQAFTYATGGAVGQGSATSTFAASPGTSNRAITEAGIFNGLTATGNSGDGVLLARSVFAAVNKGTGDSLEVKWDIAFS